MMRKCHLNTGVEFAVGFSVIVDRQATGVCRDLRPMLDFMTALLRKIAAVWDLLPSSRESQVVRLS